MKKVILSLLLVTGTTQANNEIYLDQSGGSGTFTIKQTGATNKFGKDSDRAGLTGTSKTFTSITTGTGNELLIQEEGNSTTTELLIAGNTNKIDSNVKGDSNETTIDIAGNTNVVLVKADVANDKENTTSKTETDVTIKGNTNNVTFSMVGTADVTNIWTITGDSNVVNSYQQGQTGGAGHEQTVELFGSSNKVDIYQIGTKAHVLDLEVIGSDNKYTILQTDGTAATYTNPSAVTGSGS
tara:strand:- start:1859 stop:2578 length:720 start_codon:yes stop_codon:yes gene_type:complete